MHSGGSDQITNILVYIPTLTHHSALQKKKRKGLGKVATTIYIYNSFLHYLSLLLSSLLIHLWLAPQQEASELIWGERDNAAIPQG